MCRQLPSLLTPSRSQGLVSGSQELLWERRQNYKEIQPLDGSLAKSPLCPSALSSGPQDLRNSPFTDSLIQQIFLSAYYVPSIVLGKRSRQWTGQASVFMEPHRQDVVEVRKKLGRKGWPVQEQWQATVAAAPGERRTAVGDQGRKAKEQKSDMIRPHSEGSPWLLAERGWMGWEARPEAGKEVAWNGW